MVSGIGDDALLLSICIPTYNRAGYLKESLHAVTSQTTQSLSVEIILFNNCSINNTQKIIAKYSENKEIISIKQSENIRAVKNVLKLVKEYTQGKYG